MISTAFDPAFLSSRKGVAIRPDLKKTGMAGCPRIKNAVLLKKPSMRGHPLLPELQLVATKGCKSAAGVPPDPGWLAGFLFRKTGGGAAA